MTTTTTAGAPAPAGGRRVIPGRARQILLDTIRTEQGEWTVGRVKALYRKTVPTHMLRSVIRRHLRELTTAGHLHQIDAPARRYYTYCPHGGDR